MLYLQQFNALVLKVAGWIVILAMGAIAVIVPYEVFCRYVLGNMSMWGTEFLQYSLVWATMLGGAVGLKRGYQIGITSLTDNLPAKASAFVQTISYLMVLIFLCFVTYYGFDQAWMNQSQVSSTMNIPMSIPYLALPIGFLIMVLVTIEQLIEHLTCKSRRD